METSVKIELQHQHAAHCESGVMSTMLTHYGLPLSEPMVFGLSASIAFAYLPIIKIGGMPLIAYRMPPRHIIKGLQKQLKLKISFQTFREPLKGMQALDRTLAAQKLVGLQTSVYWLPYFPPDMRFHFNAHNLLVYGKQNNLYLVSDPVFEAPVIVEDKDLQKARFAKGALAAKGMMYHLDDVPSQIDLQIVIKKAIKANARTMTGAPLPYFGINGIRHLGKKIRRLHQKHGDKFIHKFLSHVVRMQEEIGTGGAGFRFIYASFLQEASEQLNGSALLVDASHLMTNIGDKWREFAMLSVKMCKGRTTMDSNALAVILNECADMEKKLWDMLKRF